MLAHRSTCLFLILMLLAERFVSSWKPITNRRLLSLRHRGQQKQYRRSALAFASSSEIVMLPRGGGGGITTSGELPIVACKWASAILLSQGILFRFFPHLVLESNVEGPVAAQAKKTLIRNTSCGFWYLGIIGFCFFVLRMDTMSTAACYQVFRVFNWYLVTTDYGTNIDLPQVAIASIIINGCLAKNHLILSLATIHSAAYLVFYFLLVFFVIDERNQMIQRLLEDEEAADKLGEATIPLFRLTVYPRVATSWMMLALLLEQPSMTPEMFYMAWVPMVVGSFAMCADSLKHIFRPPTTHMLAIINFTTITLLLLVCS